MLMRALTVDSKAVQRHRVTILECVKVLNLVLQLLFCVSYEIPAYCILFFFSFVFTGYGMLLIPQN